MGIVIFANTETNINAQDRLGFASWMILARQTRLPHEDVKYYNHTTTVWLII
jgi:hypothetical protein